MLQINMSVTTTFNLASWDLFFNQKMQDKAKIG